MSIGANAAISRQLGRGDKAMAERTISQAVYISFVLGLLMTVFLLVFAGPLITVLGGGSVRVLAMDYCIPLFCGTLVFVFFMLLCNILRSEGAASRAMAVTILSAVINIALDPVMIYGLNMGIAGAAVSSVLASLAPIFVIIYWYFVKKDTCYTIRFSDKRPDWKVLSDISRIGIPFGIQIIIVPITSMVMYLILGRIGGIEVVVVFSIGWKIIYLMQLIPSAMASASLPVFSVAYEAKDKDKIISTYKFAVRFAMVPTLVAVAIVAVFAPQIIDLFMSSGDSPETVANIAVYLRISCIFIPILVWKFVATGMFRAFGKGRTRCTWPSSRTRCSFRRALFSPSCSARLSRCGSRS